MEQIHNTKIKNISDNKDIEKNGEIKGVDGIYFKENLNQYCLGIRVADCMPIFFFDSNRFLGGVHAGWRGIAGNIGAKFLKRVKKDAQDKNISVIVGPYICGRCFEAGPEVREKFPPESVKGKKVDLLAALKTQLKICGVNPEKIIYPPTINICTYENDLFYSHRRGDIQRMLAFAIQS